MTTSFPSSPSSSSICNASQGSFGLQQQQQQQPTIKSVKPAVELVHRSTGISTRTGSSLRKTATSAGIGTTGSSSCIPPISCTSVPPAAVAVTAAVTTTTTSKQNGIITTAGTFRSDTVSVATPSSVHLIRASSSASHSKPYALSRDLSDLSGSYYNGATGGGGGGRSSGAAAAAATFVSPYSNDPNEARMWRHAKVLSSQRLPQHPQPHYIDDESSYGANHNYRNSMMKQKSLSINNKSAVTNISFERGGDIIEVSMPNTNLSSSATDSITGAAERKVNRIPLILVLMDPTRKLYELLQLWIDTSIDTVRDILQTINKNLDNHNWKQDYDGLFQIRNNHFSPLIHVLPAGKYDIVPGEVWICKPWSMTSKQTVTYAGTCLNHLKSRHILQYRKCSDYGPIWKQWKVFRNNNNNSNTMTNHNNNKLDDTVLVLSKKATQRLYVPGGILKHHHACQFLAFVPPMENYDDDNDHINIGQKITTTSTTLNDCSQSTASGLSDSHCDDDDDDHEEDQTLDILEDTDDEHMSGDIQQAQTTKNTAHDIYNSDNIKVPTDHANVSLPVDGTFSITDDDDIGTQSSFVGRGVGAAAAAAAATVCSAKTKESTYIFRTYAHADHGSPTKSLWNSSNNRPIPHVLPSNSFAGTFNDRPVATTSSSPFQKVIRRFLTLFHCRQQSMLNRRSRSYDEQLYYQSNNNYTATKERKSSGTTARTTLLSDDASMLTTDHPFDSRHNRYATNRSSDNNNNQHQQQQWREIDTASHCSGVPLLLTSAPTADWVTHI